MTVKDIGELRFNELERLLEGFSKNNKDQGTSNGKSKDRLEDQDALRFLIDNGGKI